MLYFVDSNILLRTLVKEDEQSFRECYQFLNLVQEKKIRAFTSSLVLAEINWVLESFYKFNKAEIIQALKSILNLRGLKILDITNPNLAIELFRDFNVEFIDCLIASNPLIVKKEAKIVSYDKDFDKLKITRIVPKKFLKPK